MPMDPPRRLPAFAFIKFMMDRPAAFTLGVILGLGPLVLMIPIAFMVSSIESDNPDFQSIKERGAETDGVVTGAEIASNIEINGVNPVAVTYKYPDASGTTTTDTMRTMSVATVRGWRKGQTVRVKHFGGDSMIVGLEPVDFPFWIFGVVVLIFAMFGLPFLVYSAVGALKKKRLYVDGRIKEGKMLSIAPVRSFFAPFIRGRFEVNYAFVNSSGEEEFGKSVTTDLVLVNEKKKGDPVNILFLPGDEKKNCAVDDALLARRSQA